MSESISLVPSVHKHEETEKHTFSIYYPQLTSALPAEILKRLFPTTKDSLKSLNRSELKKEMNKELKKEEEEKKKKKAELKKARRQFAAEQKRLHRAKGKHGKVSSTIDADTSLQKKDVCDDKDEECSENDSVSSSLDDSSLETDNEETLKEKSEKCIQFTEIPQAQSSSLLEKGDEQKELTSKTSQSSELNSTTSETQFVISFPDAILWHRAVNVLRFTVGTPLILFNKHVTVTCLLHDKTFQSKNTVAVLVQQVEVTKPISPKITLFPALVKRETMETIAYYCAQMGCRTVQPIISLKTHRSWGGTKEKRRLELLGVSACEQSKSFYPPSIKQPIHFHQLLASIDFAAHPKGDCADQSPKAEGARDNSAKQSSSTKPSSSTHQPAMPPPSLVPPDSVCLFFEPEGCPLLEALIALHRRKPKHISLLFGPEGGLVDEEQNALMARGWVRVALTPTILRSQEAVAVALGAVRSVFNDKAQKTIP